MGKLGHFCAAVGLHPLAGFGMFAIDQMLFFKEGATFFVSWPISVAVAGVLTIPVILIQRYGMKESWGLAIGKGAIVGVITAIPTGIPAIATFGAAVAGSTALLLPEDTQNKPHNNEGG